VDTDGHTENPSALTPMSAEFRGPSLHEESATRWLEGTSRPDAPVGKRLRRVRRAANPCLLLLASTATVFPPASGSGACDCQKPAAQAGKTSVGCHSPRRTGRAIPSPRRRADGESQLVDLR